MVPGNVQQNQLTFDALWHTAGLSIGVTSDLETLIGDRTNEAYWVEPLAPQDNPHVGSTTIGYSIVFPTRPGTDDFNAARFGVTQVRASLFADRLNLRAGWFDLAQTLGSVFTAPATTNALPNLLVKPPESLNPNAPALDSWAPSPVTLPLRGFDAVYRSQRITFEASDAALPSLPGTPARLESVSAGEFDDAGHGGIVQWIAVHAGGDPIGTTTGFGAQAQIDATDQGIFSVSTLFGQRESIAGAKFVEPVGLGIDATGEYSHSTYRAEGIGKPGSAQGSFEHGGLSHQLGAATLGVHYYRFEPTFATMILPYGVPENIWSVAYSWPGPWLKSDFQHVDSTTLGVNREGPVYSYSLDSKSSQTFVTYSDFRQIAPNTPANSGTLGFVEGFYLVQLDPRAATIGHFVRTSVYVGKLTRFGEVGLDYVDDGLHRDARAREPFDAVSYDAPQYVLSLSRRSASRLSETAGVGYFGIRGSWADGPATNVDIGMRVAFAGAQLAESGNASVMMTLRHSDMLGTPYFGALGAVVYRSPNFSATTLLLEQRCPF